MNLWDRIERWRSEAEEYERLAEVSKKRGDTVMNDRYLDMAEVVKERAADLEADLRELQAVVEKLVTHKIYFQGPDAKEVHVDCPRCALEARIGGGK